MKKCLIVLLCLVLCGCSKKPQLNEQQSKCEHTWVEISWDFKIIGSSSYDIYCPKCKLEMKVSPKQWKKILADMNHRNSN